MSIPLGRFALESPLAEGGMGQVWRGRDVERGTRVAIKLVSADKVDDLDYAVSFQREVRAVARLDHPGIIRVHDYGQVPAETEQKSGGRLQEGMQYLVMEHASSTLLSQSKDMDWVYLRHLIDSLLDALAHAHARGVVHRDLKPQNLLIATREDARPGLKLTDFGIAQALSERTGHRAGTPPYMAPEQIVGGWRDLGPWTDLYALGCVIWRLTTGHTPFFGHKGMELFRAHLRDPPPEFRARFAVPEDLEVWLRRLLAKKPEKRFARAHQAKEVLALMIPHTLSVRRSTLVPEASPDEDFTAASTVRAVSMGQRQQIPDDWRGRRRPTAVTDTDLGGLGLFGLRPPPFVDRDTERDRIWAAIRGSRDRRALTVVGFTGVEGSGRTRLLEWTAERSHEIGGFDTLHIRCAEEGSPLWRALDELLRTHGLPRTERAERLDPILRRVDPRARDGVLDVLADDAVPEESLATFRALAIEAIAQEKRLLVAMDDLDASGEMQDFLRFLIERQKVRPSPIAVVVTAAPGFALEGVEMHPLPPFDAAAHQALLREMLGLPEEVAGRVADRSEGLPGRALQVLGRWVRDGHLVRGPDGYVLSADAVEAPSSEAAWGTRLRRLLSALPAEAEAMLELAAVLGMHVDDTLWQRVCDDPEGLDTEEYVRFSPENARIRNALFAALVDGDLAREGEDGWAFRQAGFRDAILRAAREAGRLRGHHEVCARALGTTFRDLETTRSLVGRHLLGAGDPESALDMLIRSVEPTLKRYGPSQALQILARCDDARRAAGLGDGDARAIEVGVERARMHQLLGDPGEALRLAEQARIEARREQLDTLAAQAALIIARSHLARLSWLAAEKAASNGLDLLSSKRRPALAGELYAALSEARRQLPGRDAIAPLLHARKAMRRMAGVDAERQRIEVDARLALLQDDPETAARRAADGVRIASGHKDLPSLHRLLAMQGTALRRLERLDEAEAALKEALEVSRLLGDASWPEHLARLLTCTYRHRGPAAASGLLKREARAIGGLGDGVLLVPLYLVSSAIASWEGQWENAESHISRVAAHGDALEATEDNWVVLSDTARRLAAERRPSAASAWRLAQNVAEFARSPEWMAEARSAQEALG